MHIVADQGETAVGGAVFGHPGTYVAYCTVPGHREAGMELPITVGQQPSRGLLQACWVAQPSVESGCDRQPRRFTSREEDRLSEDEMFDLGHQIRTRNITSKAFTGDRILAAILFEGTMARQIEGVPSATYLWQSRNVVPFVKADSVQVMQPMPPRAPHRRTPASQPVASAADVTARASDLEGRVVEVGPLSHRPVVEGRGTVSREFEGESHEGAAHGGLAMRDVALVGIDPGPVQDGAELVGWEEAANGLGVLPVGEQPLPLEVQGTGDVATPTVAGELGSVPLTFAAGVDDLPRGVFVT